MTNHASHTSLRVFAAEESCRRAGVLACISKVMRAKELALQAEKQLHRRRLIKTWLEFVDAMPLRQPKTVSESSEDIVVEFTLALHHARHESMLRHCSKDPEKMKMIQLQKEITTRMLGRECIDDQHWSQCSWLESPDWLNAAEAWHNKCIKKDFATAMVAPFDWCELEFDDDEHWDISDDYAHECHDSYFVPVPEPIGQVAECERAGMVKALQEQYSKRTWVIESVFGYGHHCMWQSLMGIPVPGFCIRVRVRFSKRTLHFSKVPPLICGLQSFSDEACDPWLVRALEGLRAAAVLALRSSKRGFWQTFHPVICSFVPARKDVRHCLEGLELHWQRKRAEYDQVAKNLLPKL